MAVSDREMGAPTKVKWQKNGEESDRERRGEREREKRCENEQEEQARVLRIHVNFTHGFSVGKKKLKQFVSLAQYYRRKIHR